MMVGENRERDGERPSASVARPISEGCALPSQTIPEVDGPVDLTEPSFLQGLTKDLQVLAGLLRWADQCLASPQTDADAESMRSRARFVIAEARELLGRCRDEVEAVQALATIR